jgi:hypothetical protein
MGKLERAYRARIQRAFSEIERAEVPPPSPEEAFRRFFQLMEAIMPVIDKLPHPSRVDDTEPDEVGFYERWRQLESRRRAHA